MPAGRTRRHDRPDQRIPRRSRRAPAPRRLWQPRQRRRDYGQLGNAGKRLRHAGWANARGDGFVPVIEEDRGPADRAAPYEQASLALRSVVDIGGAELQANVSGFTDGRDRGVDFTRVASDGADASIRLVERGDWGWSALGYVQIPPSSRAASPASTIAQGGVGDARSISVPATGMGGRIEVAPPIGGGVTLRLGGDMRHVSAARRNATPMSRGARRAAACAGGGAPRSAALPMRATKRFRSRSMPAGGSIAGRSPRVAARASARRRAGAHRSGLRRSQRHRSDGARGGGFAAGPVTLRAAAYRGCALPTLNELYRPFRVGADATAANAALDPERLSGAESESTGSRLAADAARHRLLEPARRSHRRCHARQRSGHFPGVGFVSAAGVYRQRQISTQSKRAGSIRRQVRKRTGQHRRLICVRRCRVRASGVAAALDGLRPAQTAAHQASATMAWRRGISVRRSPRAILAAI